MLLPKRVKHRRQFRGSMAVRLQEAIRSLMVNSVLLQQNLVGSNQIR